MSADIRKLAVWVEETHQEAGRTVAPATRKAVAVAVIANPFAGEIRRGSLAFDGDWRRTW